MDVPDTLTPDGVLARALESVNGNRAELARRVGRSEPAVSRWFSGRSGLDYDSALRLAKLTGLPVRPVLLAFGLDPELLPPLRDEEQADHPLARDVKQRVDGMVDVVENLSVVPESEWRPKMTSILDRAESDLREWSRALRALHEGAARPFPHPVPPTTKRPARRVTKTTEPLDRYNVNGRLSNPVAMLLAERYLRGDFLTAAQLEQALGVPA